MNLFDLAATLRLETSEYENGIKSARASAAVFAREMTKGSFNLSGVGKNLETIGKNVSRFGQGIVKVGKVASLVTAGVGVVFGAAFKKAKQFIGTYESAMTVFTRKLGGGKQAAEKLYDGLVKIAKGSAFAQEHMVSAGQTLVAMGLDADKTQRYVQAATDAIAGMGGSGEEVEEMATLFAKISQQTNLYTQDIQQMVERGIPAWDILATKYHTTTDEVKNMASKGLLPASESLETITGALEESDEASEMFKYSMHGLAAELKNGTLTGTLDSLNTSFRDFSLKLLDLDPRTESGKQNIEKLNKAISTFGKTLEKIGEKFGKVVGQDIVNGLDAVTRCLENFNNALERMSPEQVSLIVHTIEAIAVAGPVLIVVGTAIKWCGDAMAGFGKLLQWISDAGVIKGVTDGFTALSGAVGGTTAALGVIAAAIVAVIAVVVALKRHWSQVVKWFKSFNLGETFSRLSKTTSEVMGKFKKLGDLMEVIGVIIGAVLMPIVTGFMVLMGSLIQVFDGLMTVVGGVVDVLAGLGELIIGLFTMDGEKIQQAWNDIWNGCLDSLKGTVKAIIGVFDSSGIFNGLLFEPLASSSVAFSETVSEESKKAIQAYMDLDREATIELNKLLWSSSEVTDQTKDAICSKYDDMEKYVVGKITDQKDKSIAVLQDMVSESSTLSEEEKKTIIDQTTKTYDESAKKVTDGNNRIKEIMNNAAKEKRQITEDEKNEIVKIQEDMKNDCVKAVSQSAEEQKAIYEDLKLSAGSLSAEQCSEVVKQSKKQMDTTIEDAKKEYHDRLKAAQDLRAKGGEENEKLADKVETEAKNQYDAAVEKAKQMHNDVVKEAQKQAEEHGSAIDGETGDVLTGWDLMCKKVGEWFGNLGTDISKGCQDAWNSVSTWFGQIGQTISTSCQDAWNGVTTWFGQIGQTISKNCQDAWNGVTTWFSQIGTTVQSKCMDLWSRVVTVWNNIKTAITTPIMSAYNSVRGYVDTIKSVVIDKFNSVSSTVRGIWDGIKGSISSAMETASSTVRSIIDRIKGFFNFNISWPHIPVPEFHISPPGWRVGDLLQGSIPSLSISWHAKGGIFTKPTLFETAGGLHGVGEAGAEAVLPIKVLKEYIKEAMAEGVKEAQIAYKDSATGKANIDMMNALMSTTNGKEQQINVYIGGKKIASEIYDPLMDIMKRKEVRVGA